MFLSAREQIILKELLTSIEPVSIKQLMSLLKVSRRTVYRELENLELSLQSIGAVLERASRGTVNLSASEEVLAEIKQIVMGDESEALSSIERQHAILLELLLTQTPISMQWFLDKYFISNTTFYGDVKLLEERMLDLPLKIVRNRGYEIEGSEKYRRLLIASVLGSELNEYQFFHSSEDDLARHFFYQFLNLEDLIFSQRIIQEKVSTVFSELSDRKVMQLVLMLTLSIERVRSGHPLDDEGFTGIRNKALLKIAKQVFAQTAEKTKLLYSVNEIVFFASLLANFSTSFEHDFFEEDFDTSLAYSVKELIQRVSDETDIPFFQDDTLYQMLLTHLSGVFSRAILKEQAITNPILEQIMSQYPEIAEALRSSLPQVFQEKRLSEEEIAYMVIHFANSLEHHPQELMVDIAGFSPSGLASNSILETRLRRYFPFIHHIDFFRVADLNELNQLEEYDLVIATSPLPGYKGHYKLVSPLLLESEIAELKEAFKKLEHHPLKKKKTSVENSLNTDSYEFVVAFIDEVNAFLQRFFIKTLDNNLSLDETLGMSLETVSDEIVLERLAIQHLLMQRYEQAPVGIPDTGMGLFHTASSQVALPFFAIYDLETPIPIEGMDRQEMVLSRLLLMLAPQSIEENAKKILGRISGAIMMNDLYTEIFRSGNQAIVHQLLTSLLIEEVTQGSD